MDQTTTAVGLPIHKLIYSRQRVLFLHDEGGVIAVGSEKGARDEAKSEYSQYNITLDRQYNHQYSHKSRWGVNTRFAKNGWNPSN